MGAGSASVSSTSPGLPANREPPVRTRFLRGSGASGAVFLRASGAVLAGASGAVLAEPSSAAIRAPSSAQRESSRVK